MVPPLGVILWFLGTWFFISSGFCGPQCSVVVFLNRIFLLSNQSLSFSLIYVVNNKLL